MNEKILSFGQETYGSHPKVMRTETLKRYNQLPVFLEVDLKKYATYATLSQPLFNSSDYELERYLLLFGWDPEKMGDWVKQTILSRNIELSKLSRRMTLNNWYPDKTYRIETNKHPNLVVESLDDIFVVKLTLTKQGVFKPVSARWLKRNSVVKTQ